jgi:hypothetical protein
MMEIQKTRCLGSDFDRISQPCDEPLFGNEFRACPAVLYVPCSRYHSDSLITEAVITCSYKESYYPVVLISRGLFRPY